MGTYSFSAETVSNAGTLDFGNGTHTVSGDFSNTGTLAAGTSTVNFTGANKTLDSGGESFHAVEFPSGSNYTVVDDLRGDITIDGGTLSPTVPLTGDITVKAGTFSPGVDLSGKITIDGGTLSPTVPLTGDITVKAGTFSPGVDLSGKITIDGGTLSPTVPLTGAITVNGGTVTAANNLSGDVSLPSGSTGTLSLTPPLTLGSLAQSGGAVTVANGSLITVTGAVNQTGGSITGTGGVTIKAEGTGGIVINGGISAAGAIGLSAADTASGSVSGSGAISGTGLTVTAKTGINLGGSNTAGSVSLTNAASGNIIFNNAAALSLGALSAAGGNITITTQGASGYDITVTGSINTSGNVVLEARDADADIAINGSIGNSSAPKTLGISASGTGGVTINADITVAGAGTGPGVGSVPGDSLDLRAEKITRTGGSVSVTAPNGGDIHLHLNDASTLSGVLSNMTVGNAYYVYILPQDPNHDIIFYSGTNPAGSGHFPAADYTAIEAGVLAGRVALKTSGGKGIYAVNVSEGIAALKLEGTFIEFYQDAGSTSAYEYTGNSASHLVLSPGSGGVRTYHAASATAAISIGAASFAVPSGAALNILQGSASISVTGTGPAAGISLDAVTGTSGEDNHLTLSSSGNRNISTGALGTGGQSLGNITISNAADAAIGGPVYAAGFTQSAGSGTTSFNAAQNYTKGFSFTGTNLTVNNTLQTDSDNTNDDGPFSFNGAALTLNGALTTGGGGSNAGYANTVTVANTGAFRTGASGSISAGGAFAQTGGGANSLAADITTRNGAAANASIDFAAKITLAGHVTLDSSAGNGTITLPAVSGVSVDYSAAGNFGLNSGTGDITINGSVSVNGKMTQTGTSAITKLFGNITTVNQNIGFEGPVELNNDITINSGTGAGGISLAAVNGPGKNLSLVFGAGVAALAGTVGEDAVKQLGTLTLTGSSAGISAVNDIYAASVVFGGTAVGLSQGSGKILYANVTINAGCAVTAAPGTVITQDPARTGRTLTLAAKGSPAPAGAILNTAAGSWYVGPPTLPSPSWYMLSNPSASSAGDPSYINPGPQFSSGFAGFNGTLNMGNGSTLTTKNFYTQITDRVNTPPDHKFTLNAPSSAPAMCYITASGSVTINETFEHAANSTLAMTGDGGKLAVRSSQPPGVPQPPRFAGVELGHFTADAGGLTGVVIDSSLIVAGNVTINSGKILTAHTNGSPHIQVWGGWNNVGGNFVPRRSIVEFGAYNSNAGREFHITGNTEFYELVCLEPSAKILFSNWPHEHRVTGKFTAFPSDAPYPGHDIGYVNNAGSNMLKLSRLTGTDGVHPNHHGGALPTDTFIPPETPSNEFWYFDLAPGSGLDIRWVSIYYSFSSKRLPTPVAEDNRGLRIDAFPYQAITDPKTSPPTVNPNLGTPLAPEGSYYNVNWFAPNQFYYAFTEDTDGNGRIDRLRLQSPFELVKDWPPGSKYAGRHPFAGFEVAVAGYEVDRSKGYNGYARADWNGSGYSNNPDKLDSIFVYLVEKGYTDGGARLNWTLISNEYLYDLTTRSIQVGDPSEPDHSGRSWDTVPPRINYALTLPGTGKQEIYFQMSEPVDRPAIRISAVGPGSSSVALLSSPCSPRPLDLSGNGASQFLIDLDKSYQITDLAAASPPEFTVDITTVKDLAEDAVDKHYDYAADPYAYKYPSPKYPVNYTYSGYEFVRNKIRPPGTPWSTQPIGAPNVLDHPGGVNTHRVTDALVSVPPSSLYPDKYFAWPVFARYSEQSNSAAPALGIDRGFWEQNPEDTGIIWEFHGKKYLEERDAALQFKLGAGLSVSMTLGLRYAFQVPGHLRAGLLNGNPGLWLPYGASPDFVNLAPDFLKDPSKPKTNHPVYTETTYTGRLRRISALLYTYEFLADDPGYDSPAMLDFFFRLDTNPSTVPNDLFAARLDINPGAAIPGNWYQLVRPFSFEIHGITLQRSGVTILNNVINPNNGESAYVHYKLVKGGQVTIQVFTLDGTMVDTLYRGRRDPGEYRAVWNGKNRGGRSAARGMYFVRVVGPDIDEIRKVMVVK
jgi:hypothetical protein